MGIGLVASLFWFRLEYKKLNFKVYPESNLEEPSPIEVQFLIPAHTIVLTGLKLDAKSKSK